MRMSDEMALATFQPKDLGQAMDVAKMLATSTIIPKHLIGKPGDILATLIAGAELGLKMMQALRAIYMANGKVGFYSDFLQAKCQEHPKCKRFEFVPEESDATRATFIAEREGQAPKKLTYTIQMAQRANLTKNDTYRAHPEAMLRARCVSALAKIVFPEVTFGLYSKDELHEIEEKAEASGEAAPEEKEVNQAPSRTKKLVEDLKAKQARIVDVKAGETEEEAASVPVLLFPLPNKGQRLDSLPYEELVMALSWGELQIQHKPNAKNAPKVREHISELKAEMERRGDPETGEVPFSEEEQAEILSQEAGVP